MAASVRDYVKEIEQIDYILLIKKYGEPRKIAVECVDSMSDGELISNMKHSRKVMRIMVVLFCVGISIWLAAIAYLCYHSINSFYGYVDVEITIVEESALVE